MSLIETLTFQLMVRNLHYLRQVVNALSYRQTRII